MTVAIATLPPVMEKTLRLLTAVDLAALPSELPSGSVRYELDNGRLVIMPPTGYTHGQLEVRLGSALLIQGEWRGFGKACCGEVGVILWRNPDRVVGVDAAFIAAASLPLRRSAEGYLETIPDLIAEVVSKNDPPANIEKKVQDYLKAGVRLAWVADPSTKTRFIRSKGAHSG